MLASKQAHLVVAMGYHRDVRMMVAVVCLRRAAETTQLANGVPLLTFLVQLVGAGRPAQRHC
jgi:hypothetical protein